MDFWQKMVPSGTITMWDSSLNKAVPIEGAQVLMRQWFTVRQGITNADGYFSTSSVRGSARYIIQWERHHYDVRDGLYWQAETRGPSLKQQAWNPYITDIENSQFAMIHKAAHHYYYKDIKGLTRPHRNGEMKGRMKISAMNKSSDESSLNGDYNYWLNFISEGRHPNIRIFRRNYSAEYYGTVIHELTHSAHFKMAPFLGFANIDDNVKESWARGVQWDLSRMVYANYSIEYHGDYTGIVQDLIDNDNSYADYTTGYTIKQIENSVKGSKTWQEWRDKLKNNYENTTENKLDIIFNYWFNHQLLTNRLR